MIVEKRAIVTLKTKMRSDMTSCTEAGTIKTLHVGEKCVVDAEGIPL